jgi:hypothetical protein
LKRVESYLHGQICICRKSSTVELIIPEVAFELTERSSLSFKFIDTGVDGSVAGENALPFWRLCEGGLADFDALVLVWHVPPAGGPEALTD